MERKQIVIAVACIVAAAIIISIANVSRCGPKQVQIIIFSASWCPHCQQLRPTIDALQENANNPLCSYTIIVIDTDDEGAKEMQGRYNVNSFPTIFMDEQMYNGNRDYDTILAQIR